MDYIWLNREDPEVRPYFELAVAKRPYEELYSIKEGDHDCLNNLIDDPKYANALDDLRKQMDDHLLSTQDPRATGNGDILQSYRNKDTGFYPDPGY